MRDTKPYFKTDLLAILSSTYFSLAIHGKRNRDYWFGVLKALVSLAIAFGVNQNAFLSEEDNELIRNKRG